MATIDDALAIGWKLFQAGELARAEGVFHKVVEIDPLAVQAWYLLGAVQQLQQKLDDAMGTYQRVLTLAPRHAEALNNLGVMLHARGITQEALACFRKALAEKPEYPDALSNLGNALHELGALDEAVASYQSALRLNQNHFDAHNNLGNALRTRGDLAASVRSYEQALRLKPDNAQVRLSRALCWLEAGDFESGWPEYEWRLQCPEFAIPIFRQPRWDGSGLNGRSILLYADHGLGDTIQFIRYAPMVRAFGGDVIVACPRPLAQLLASCPGVDRIVEEGAELPPFDVYIPIMSLAGVFATTAATVPADVPYLWPELTRFDSQRRAAIDPDGFNIGIAWQGNPRYRQDRHRSFELAQVERLARIDGVRLFSLQKGAGVEQIDSVADRFAVRSLGSMVEDLNETAAVMRSLDLVITPDSALAHLAGAVGAPVWVALAYAADWRWQRERTDSPWYPTMRLFRQTTWGQWDDVFAMMEGTLLARLEAGDKPP